MPEAVKRRDQIREGDPSLVRELLRTNDLVEISWLLAVLKGEGIEAQVLDGHMSIAEGSISAIPRRIVVEDRDYFRSIRALDRARADLARGSDF